MCARRVAIVSAAYTPKPGSSRVRQTFKEMIVESAYVGPTAATLMAGIAGNDAALLAATDVKTAARTALLLTSPLLCNSGGDVRITLAYTVANATAGKARVRVFYTIDDKADAVSPN